jgi:hypothetical protein
VELGQADVLDELGAACVEAEDALVEALNQMHELQSGEAELSREQGYLAALGRYADNEDNEPQQ